MKIFYSPSYTIAGHSFETTRKSQWIAESLAREPIAGIELVAPKPTSAAALSSVHDRDYVDAMRTGNPRELAESQGFHWDPALWEMVCASNGGVVAAPMRSRETTMHKPITAIDHSRTNRLSISDLHRWKLPLELLGSQVTLIGATSKWLNLLTFRV